MVCEMLLRKNKIWIMEEKEDMTQRNALNDLSVATLMKNIEPLGYTFSRELYEELLRYSTDQLGRLCWELVELLKKSKGADHKYRPMYRNFPMEVMAAPAGRLYLNALVHYWSNGTMMPASFKAERKVLTDIAACQVLTLGSREEAIDLFQNLLSAKSSLSLQDKEDIAWCFANLGRICMYIPQSIPIKENAAWMGKCYIEKYPLAKTETLTEALKPYFKTPTDVLRLAAALSDSDVSLAELPRFISFSRPVRRLLMGLLNDASGLEEGMAARAEIFKRLGERLHPGEYPDGKYDRVKRVFAKLRNGERIVTFAGSVADAIKAKDVTSALKLLRNRPGELARRLDHLLRLDELPQSHKHVLSAWEDVAAEVSVPVLLQVREHFRYRNGGAMRYYFPKGNMADGRIIEPLPNIDEELCERVIAICERALIQQFAQKEAMGKVYLSEKMKNYIVPFNQRSASKAAHTLVRGSRIPIKGGARAIRGFVWWTNTENDARVDLDLSALILDENFHYLEHVSYTNLRSEKYKACHSGDIVDGGSYQAEGVSEFLDTDIKSVIKYGGRYIIYQVYSYTRQKFSELGHAAFGFMERRDVNSGEIYEPALVKQKIDLTAQSCICVPVIFDCLTRQIIWCDVNLGTVHSHYGGNNVESNLAGVELASYAMVNMHKTNLYQLIYLHICARGIQCYDKAQADIVFDEEDGITPYDTDVIMAEYL